MKKRGQGVFGISFGVIFSVIIIIAIIGVSFYAISYFLGINNCAQTGIFYDDLQNQIDRAWTSGKYVESYEGSPLPKGITNVCFGKIPGVQRPSGTSYYLNLYEDIEDSFPPEGSNVFLVPREKACDGDLSANKLENVNLESRFACVNVTKENLPRMKITFDDNVDTKVNFEYE